MNKAYSSIIFVSLFIGATLVLPLPAKSSLDSSLGLGASGSPIQELQQILTKLGYYNGSITGYFGPLTQAAVIQFQKANSVLQSGYVGDLTRAKLNSGANTEVRTPGSTVVEAPAPALPKVTLPSGTTNLPVSTTQITPSGKNCRRGVCASPAAINGGLICTPSRSSSTRNMVVITHGWDDDAKGWVQTMASSIVSSIKSNFTTTDDWTVCTYDWSKDAKVPTLVGPVSTLGFGGSIDLAPVAAFSVGGVDGTALGGELLKREKIASIHFIAHSAGGNVIQHAAEAVRLNSPGTNIHLTFLDAYYPAEELTRNGGDLRYGYDIRNDSSTWFAEQYVDTRDDNAHLLKDTNRILPHAYNFDVWKLDSNQSGGLDYNQRVHRWPYEWYQKSVDAFNFRTFIDVSNLRKFLGGTITGAYKYGFSLLSLESGMSSFPNKYESSGYCLFTSDTSDCPLTKSLTASKRSVPPMPVPSAPANFAAAALSSSQIQLTWKAVPDDKQIVAIERNTDKEFVPSYPYSRVSPNGWNAISREHAQNRTSFLDGGLSSAKEYCYRMYVSNGDDRHRSDLSDVSCATTLPESPPPIPQEPRRTTAFVTPPIQVAPSPTPTPLEPQPTHTSGISFKPTPANLSFTPQWVFLQHYIIPHQWQIVVGDSTHMAEVEPMITDFFTAEEYARRYSSNFLGHSLYRNVHLGLGYLGMSYESEYNKFAWSDQLAFARGKFGKLPMALIITRREVEKRICFWTAFANTGYPMEATGLDCNYENSPEFGSATVEKLAKEGWYNFLGFYNDPDSGLDSHQTDAWSGSDASLRVFQKAYKDKFGFPPDRRLEWF